MNARKVSSPMHLGPDNIEWCTAVKYLGVHIISGKNISFSIDYVKRSFFIACNCIFSNCIHANEIVHLTLQESYCLPILTYAMPAIDLKVKQICALNACWNSVFRKIFGFNKWESVRCFIHGLGRLDLVHIVMMRRHTFYRHLSSRVCSALLKDIFWLYWLHNYVRDSCCKYVCLNIDSAVEHIRDDFSNSLNCN